MSRKSIGLIMTPMAARSRLAAAAAAVLAAGCAQGELALGPLSVAEPPAETASTAGAPGAVPAAREPAAAMKPSVAAAVEDARKARLAGDKLKALKILDTAAEADPKDRPLQKERGLVALDAGKVKQAEALLRKAFDPKEPDWRLHSALGSALAAQGKQSEAQLQFAKALEIVPDHPSVLNNLALSYALDGKHDEAERLLKRIAKAQGAAPRAQQNLALILGLKGKVGEARTIAESVLPPESARQNVSYLESLGSKGERATVSRAEPADAAAVASAPSRN